MTKRNNNTKFVDIEGPLKVTIIVELLPKEFELNISLRLSFKYFPSISCEHYTGLESRYGNDDDDDG